MSAVVDAFLLLDLYVCFFLENSLIQRNNSSHFINDNEGIEGMKATEPHRNIQERTHCTTK